MKIVSLEIKDSTFNKKFDLDNNIVLIHSNKNSVGKTTLLRVILYTLGFSIPSTKKFKIKDYTYVLKIHTKSGKSLVLNRSDSSFIIIDKSNESEDHYLLPEDEELVHERIFENSNQNILKSLLGAIYKDQEKGWTLLNRGTVIGQNRFNIESFLQGVGNIDCQDLYEEKAHIDKQISKYKSLADIADYKSQIEQLSLEPSYENANDNIDNEIELLKLEKKPLEIEINRLIAVLNKNNSFKEYIASMKLFVKNNNGDDIPVNEETLCGFKDNIEIINSKIRIQKNKISKINHQIKILEDKWRNNNKLFSVENMIDKLDSDISKIKIDQIAVENLINSLDKEKKKINNKIELKSKSNNKLIGDLHEVIVKYSTELGLDEKIVNPSSNYIFTNDLKSLSGAVLHKIVFSFQLAYLDILRNYLDLKLPIILDSPRGKEVDESNIRQMIDILKRDFSEHQMIIASIYEYDFDLIKTIELKNSLLE